MVEQNLDKTYSNPNMYSRQSGKQNQPRFEIPSEPTITINIGRIEVHAMTLRTPSITNANKLPPPSLSLKDYLKQRSEARQ